MAAFSTKNRISEEELLSQTAEVLPNRDELGVIDCGFVKTCYPQHVYYNNNCDHYDNHCDTYNNYNQHCDHYNNCDDGRYMKYDDHCDHSNHFSSYKNRY